jgi:hypothetical protein
MSEVLTLELPDNVVRQARALAAAANRRVEDVLVEWIERGAADPAVESLPDDQLLALCDRMMDPGSQEELSDLLHREREGTIADAERERLSQLLDAYRRGLVLKARAWKEAVARRLKPPLSDDAA